MLMRQLQTIDTPASDFMTGYLIGVAIGIGILTAVFPLF
jgi:hypothetical protein